MHYINIYQTFLSAPDTATVKCCFHSGPAGSKYPPLFPSIILDTSDLGGSPPASYLPAFSYRPWGSRGKNPGAVALRSSGGPRVVSSAPWPVLLGWPWRQGSRCDWVTAALLARQGSERWRGTCMPISTHMHMDSHTAIFPKGSRFPGPSTTIPRDSNRSEKALHTYGKKPHWPFPTGQTHLQLREHFTSDIPAGTPGSLLLL